MPSNPARLSHLQREWYIEVAGRKTGPFPADAVRDLFLEHEILGNQPLFAADDASVTLTAQELATLFSAENDSSGPASSGAIPIRPADVGKVAPGSEMTHPQEDASVGLFDTLMAAKERQKTQSGVDSGADELAVASPSFQFPGWILAAAVGAIAVGALWGLTNLLKQGSNHLDTAPAKVSTVQTLGTGAPAPAAVNEPAKAPASHAAPARPHANTAAPAAATPARPSREAEERERERERDREERERELQRERDHRGEPPTAAQVAPPGTNPDAPPPNVPGTDGSPSNPQAPLSDETPPAQD
jgi:hypothetical protein